MIDHRAFVERALEWTDRHLEFFDLFDGARPFEMKRGQRVGELAILVHVMHDVYGESASPRFSRMAALLERIRDHPEFGDRVMRSPLEFILFAEVYARLRAVGRDDARMRSLLERAVAADLLSQTERVPHRLMDIRACLDLAQIECPLPSLDDLLAGSIMARLPSPVAMREDDLYALTHVLMFLSGFGTRREPALPRQRRAPVAALLSSLIAVAALDRHLDLLAEFLICWRGCDLADDPIVERAWEALAAGQLDDGSVPGPEWTRKQHDLRDPSLSEPAWREVVFSHHYHTTLVSALAGMLWTGPHPAAQHAVRHSGAPHAATEVGSGSGDQAERAALAARAAQPWLEQTTDALLRDGDPEAQPLCLSALGVWLCHSLLHGDARPLPPAIRAIGKRLIALDEAIDPGWAQVPPALTVMAAAILGAEGLRVPYLHSQHGYVERLRLSLATRDGGTADNRFAELERLLRCVGLAAPIERRERFDAVAIEALLPTVRIDADEEWIAMLFEQLAAATDWGCATRAGESRIEWLVELAAAWGLHALRRYDLISAATRLRIVGWCTPLGSAPRMSLRHGIGYLLDQQRPEGDFGFLAPELRRCSDLGAPLRSENQLRLPVTIECLWTVTEAVRPGWRLYSALPAMNIAGIDARAS